MWLGFWTDGAVSYLKDRQLRASYTAAHGLGQPPVQHLQLDRDGALWAATLNGGLSRIKDGHVATLTSRNGLPCDGTNWTIDDDEGSLWLYMRCGLVRITRTEVDAWIADPKHRIGTTVWDSADGVRLRSSAASEYAPRVAKSADGKLWFVTGEGIQVVDPRHLVVNEIPPPVRIEQVTADRKTYDTARDLRLPPLVRDLQLDFTALSLAAPEKVRFRYKLEGYNNDWQEAGNRRQAFYTNLPPRSYRFRVIAANNSGVWNRTRRRCWSSRSRQRITRPPGSVRSARRGLWGCSGLGTRSGSGSCITGSRWRSRRESASGPALRGSCTTPCCKVSTGCCFAFKRCPTCGRSDRNWRRKSSTARSTRRRARSPRAGMRSRDYASRR